MVSAVVDTSTKSNFINKSIGNLFIVKLGKLHCGSTLQTAACYAIDLVQEHTNCYLKCTNKSLLLYHRTQKQFFFILAKVSPII